MSFYETLLLTATVCFSLPGCDSKSKDDSKAEAKKDCGADEKAKSGSAECKACCKENGVSSYQFDGMNQSCICG